MNVYDVGDRKVLLGAAAEDFREITNFYEQFPPESSMNGVLEHCGIMGHMVTVVNRGQKVLSASKTECNTGRGK